MERRPDVGLAGSRLEHVDGSPQQSTFRFPTILGEVESGLRLRLVTRLLENHSMFMSIPDRESRIDWVAGASLLVRREVFEAIGLLDDGYFMYFEEVDFCLKASRAGWGCWYVPSSRVVHLIGQSSGVTAQGFETKRRPRYWFRSPQAVFRRQPRPGQGRHGRRFVHSGLLAIPTPLGDPRQDPHRSGRISW